MKIVLRLFEGVRVERAEGDEIVLDVEQAKGETETVARVRVYSETPPAHEIGYPRSSKLLSLGGYGGLFLH